MASFWRQAFDAVERPAAAAADSWVQSETFMDLAVFSVRARRRLLREVQNASELWLHAWGLPSHGDVLRLRNELGSLAREVRELGERVPRGEARVRARQAPERAAA
jgi:hypothetical protein